MRTVLIFLVLFYVSVKRFIETLLVQIFMSILLLILKTVFIYPGLDQKSGNGKSPVWVSSNIWKLGQVRDTKFGMSVSNEKLLKVAKCCGYSFYRFWTIKGESTGLGGK